MEVRGCVLCVLLLSFALGDAKFFKFEDCSKKKDAIATVSTFKVSPDPINLDKNTTVNLVTKILRDVPPEAVLKTQYYKRKYFFSTPIDLPIPCIMGKFGSCDYKLCDFMKDFELTGKPFFPKDKEYGCPVRAGNYGGEDVDMPKPYVNMVPRPLIRGQYRAEFRLLEKPGGKEVACFKVWTEIV